MTSSVTIEHHRLSVRKVLSTLGNGATIFSGTTDSGRSLRVIAAPKVLVRLPLAGEAWLVAGEIRTSAKYGEQLHATSGRYELPRGRLIVQYLANHPDFPGIGKGKAQGLWDAFGEQLALTLASGNIDALEAVLTRSTAIRLVEEWAAKQAEAETVEFLDAYGLDWRLAVKLLRVWGSRAAGMLRANPYHLLAFASWPQVDAAAMKLGVAPDDSRRLVGAVEAALYERLQQAHTLTSRKELVDRVARYMSRSEAARALGLATAEGAVLGTEDTGFQAFGAAALESGIAQRIRAMLAGEASEQSTLFPVERGHDWAQSSIAQVEVEQGFPLNEEQRCAVVMPFEHSFGVLTGGAGVGKTTVLRAVIELAYSQNLAVVQMALAGRAAQRMAEATGHPAMTIAKFLAASRSGKLQVLPDTLVVVDEASMLDLPTLYRVLKHLPDGVRMLLVGDPAQLPPIGFGLAFHRLVGNPRVPQAHLATVHRQAASSGIPAAASDVREHRVPVFVPFSGLHKGVSFIECAADAVVQQLREVQRAWHGEDWQVLSAVKGGRAGIRNINESAHADACGRAGASPARFIVGEPVIHLVNDYERGLMNGALGRVLCSSDGGGLDLEFDGERHSFTAGELVDRIELAYAISVHKSQGSQFRRVVIVVGKSRLLDHALVYTALTRGVEQVVFVGDSQAFERAVVNPPVAEQRCVAFSV
jgi:exodeoxyribonuclease V alpha subunit